VPLIEIVSEPDIASPEEAHAYLTTLRTLLLYLGVCDGNMEEGSLRCDANVSLRPRGQEALGTKVEIKNLNSFRNVQHALEFEIRRQATALDAGERIAQETRLWDADRGYTRSMRSKEYAHDYRYFPEPDLVPLELDPAWVAAIRGALPELPRARRQRFMTEFGLPLYDAVIQTQSSGLASYFEAAVRQQVPGEPAGSPTLTQVAKTTSNWIMSELLRVVPPDDEQAIRECRVTPARLAGLVRLIDDGTISGKIAKGVFEKMLATGDEARVIVEREGLTQVADTGELARIVERAIAENPKAVEDWKRGKTAARQAFVGAVMKATAGKANPGLVSRLVAEKLSGL
jgi:aspartyl-tRNA(Asn)/glutamyl-tRNA(Gln) amidotransferase subunit B